MPDELGAVILRMRNDGLLDARGTPLDASCLRRILDSFSQDPANAGGPRRLAAVDFTGATFHEHALFGGFAFEGRARFEDARFKEGGTFWDSVFALSPIFDNAVFCGTAAFSPEGRDTPGRVRRTVFSRGAHFRRVEFQGDAWFDRAHFDGFANFRGTRFSANARFMAAQFSDGAQFDEASFEAEQILGPVLVQGRLALDESVVHRHLLVEAAASEITCIATEFVQGATLRLRRADIVLDWCIFGRPTTVSFAQKPFRERGGGFTPRRGLGGQAFDETSRVARRREQPRLLSARGADVANLTVVELDLKPSVFQAAHNRDKLQIVGFRPFAETPDTRWGPGNLPLRCWTRRQVLAEEHHWRASGFKPWSQRLREGWNPSECQVPSWLKDATGQEIEELGPDRLASIYRVLRKAQEDTRNEPGAADFYYGEMEMRRYATSRWSVERALLTAYWLVSGYALRAWRAFATLSLAIILAAVLFASVGFKPPDASRFVPIGVNSAGQLIYDREEVRRPSFVEQLPGAFGYSAETATSLLRGPDRQVTPAGEWTQAVLRWLGPALFALALVSLRGRVKR